MKSGEALIIANVFFAQNIDGLFLTFAGFVWLAISVFIFFKLEKYNESTR